MSTSVGTENADAALKAAHRSMWASGDYPALAAQVIPDLGRVLVEASGVRPGDRVLDVAAGSGNAAIPAARLGARVVACDLTPEMFAAGRRQAAEAGVEVSWLEADAEALPFRDDEFDVVVSCLGVMFAPHHRASADELVRVCRPGGTIGLLNWTPEGFIGEMFGVMKPYAPAPPAGAQPPLAWGREDYLTELFGDRLTQVAAERRHVVVDCFATPDAFRDAFKTLYGPTVAAYRSVAEDPVRSAALDHELAGLARSHVTDDGRLVMGWEYLLFTGRKNAAPGRIDDGPATS